MPASAAFLLKPQTFMNLSGESVEAACQYYKIPYDKVIVLFDDISLEPGQLRIRRKGTHGDTMGCAVSLSVPAARISPE